MVMYVKRGMKFHLLTSLEHLTDLQHHSSFLFG